MNPPVVVAAVDGSPNSIQALRRAADEAARSGSRLRVVYVYRPRSPGSGEREETAREAADDDFYYACQVIDRCIAAALGTEEPADLERVPAVGNARDVLVEMSAAADLLVVGARGQSLGLGFSLGATARACRNRASCPVLVVAAEARQPGKPSPVRASVGARTRTREGL